ncbi:APC family permease [Rhodococcus sp. AD45-ID]|jgi:amino acid transporter|uniref:Amino acid/polyamine/organocation transporter (APC superfamily) n=1 Tax=Nocardia globerula TaxID=1818 RepID=A0A652YT14_NOCGL|nr:MULTISPECIES: APC family permease [Rhodococcus]NMD61216.1 APC family permease [Nocardia globerula]KJF21347.1 Putrescine importer PuuP [Rhodococcus sp. AD45]MCE4268880.1 APC family permease [Rhodococcus globerulus]MDV8068720.1 APC family permease [Rhodococcus sp. IEGM 1366]NRI64913.1 APC family permease [Rhodococcus sp. MS16]
MTSNETSQPPAGNELSSKGLATGKIGMISGAVLGISSVAPGYTLTASIGLIVAAVGLKMPAIFIAGFIPMFLTAYAYRELNSDTPDCGASFTWSTKAFGPYVGWMCGWGMVIATIIVLSNLAAIAVDFFYLFIARVVDNPSIADLPGNKLVNVGTTLVFIALATWIASRGITTSERVQFALVGFQMVLLVVFAVVALVHVGAGDAPAGLSFDLSWFNPFSGLAIGAFVIGLTGSIFAFWGWDTCLTLGEESKNPKKTPGRAGLLCVATILLTYLLVAVAAMMYAGVGEEGLGLGNPENSENVFGALADPVLGDWGGMLLFLAVFVSSVASLQTTFLPAARTMLAMGAYGAFPKKLAEVSPRFLVPSYATVVAGVVTAVFYTVVTFLSESALLDTIAALGIMICWYYGITAFACVWYFRRTVFDSMRNFVFRLAFPLLGGLMLLAVFVISIQESMDPENASGASIGGIGLVFFLGFGILILGAVLMMVMRVRNPEFFEGKTLNRDTVALRDESDLSST